VRAYGEQQLARDRLRLSIIIPVLNEAPRLEALGPTLAGARAAGCEVIVVDGGSDDASCAVARTFADIVIIAPRGRANQLNAGARVASQAVLWFVHADSQLPATAYTHIQNAVGTTDAAWGRFDIDIVGRARGLAIIAWFINQRSRMTGVATGDQGIFVTRALFDAVGGFPALPLMEDVAICKALRRIRRPFCLTCRIGTSGRRWETHGIIRTVILMWRLRFDYWRGVDPHELHARYTKAPAVRTQREHEWR
jgi:rSAM/selenodomain-associated transferase 2